MTSDDARPAIRTAVVWGTMLTAVVTAGCVVADGEMRRRVLRAVLLLMAAGEAAGAYAGMFMARRMAASTGRPYDPAYHGVRQDFGFYNLATALLLVLCAVDPDRNAVVLTGAIVLYAVHGGTHLLRYLGIYYGGETPIPSRPRHLELRDAAPLLVALAGMLAFRP